MKRDPLEYVLNRLESAALSDEPAKHGYAEARKELLVGIAQIRAEVERLTAQLEQAHKKIREVMADL